MGFSPNAIMDNPQLRNRVLAKLVEVLSLAFTWSGIIGREERMQ